MNAKEEVTKFISKLSNQHDSFKIGYYEAFLGILADQVPEVSDFIHDWNIANKNINEQIN